MAIPTKLSPASTADTVPWSLGFKGGYLHGIGDRSPSGPMIDADASLHISEGNVFSFDLFGGIGWEYLTQEGEGRNALGLRAGIRGNWFVGGGISLFAEPSVGVGTHKFYDFSALLGLGWSRASDLPLTIFLGVGPRYLVADDIGYWMGEMVAGISLRFDSRE